MAAFSTNSPHRHSVDVTVLAIDFPHLADQLRTLTLTNTPFDRLVVAGGDGTVSAVLTHAELPDIPIGVIPLGTANDVARELNLVAAWGKLTPHEFVSRLCQLPTTPFATWNLVAGDRTLPFAAYCSFGYEGLVVRDFSAWRSASPLPHSGRFRNRLAYTTSGVRHLGYRLPALDITTNSGETKAHGTGMSLLLTNIRAYMGLGYSNRDSSAQDTLIECSITRSVMDYLRIIGSGVGIAPALTPVARGSSITLSGLPEDVSLQIDGEAVAPLRSSTCRIELRRMVRVVAGC